MINLNDVLLYLDCPKKFALSKAGVVKEASDNDKLKAKVKDAILKCLQNNLTVVQFADEVGTITHGKTNVKVDSLYNLIQDNKDKLLDKDYRLSVALKTPTNGYEQSLYYNLYQVLECENKELKFNVIVLNINPKLEQITLAPRTQEQIKEAKLMVQSVDRIINTVEKEQLVYIKRPNNINCSSCCYNKECKPLCFTREETK
jgi:hypothetical protein